MAQAMWICQPCGRTMNLNTQAAHLAGQPHANAIAAANANGLAAQAVPPMVNAPVPTVVGGPIRGARRRRERGQVRGQVRGRGRGRGARGRGGNPGGAMPHSASDDDDGIDDWDARGILHDIDTQWGAMPHGGAYKESNTYYGSGDYDFY